ncbi:MAG: outer membrane protein transport protein [Gemmatimonadota bacterium]
MNTRAMRPGTVLAALAMGLVAAPSAAQTNGYVLHCMSARAAGQGCVTRAQPALPSSLFRDPAGLAAFDRAMLEVNAAPFLPSITFENAANTRVDGTRHVYPLGSVAFVGRPLGDLAWAVGFEPIGGFGSDFQLKHELLSGSTGDLIDYESYFAAAKAGPAVAYELAPGLSVGASASLVYGQIRDFRMPFSMPPSTAKGMAAIPGLDPAVYGPLFQQFTELTAYGNSEGFSGFTWAADLGIGYRRASGFAVSASWAPERALEVDGGGALIDMSAQFGQMMMAMVSARAEAYQEDLGQAQAAVLDQLAAAGIDPSVGMAAAYEAATTITLPMTAGLGMSVPLTGAWKVSGEAEWRRWSTAEDVMPFRLTGGENANINLMVNGDPADGSFTYPFPLHWQDTWTVKLGTEYALGSTALRTGFIYGENPVPHNTVFITFPAICTRALTAGVGWTLWGFPLDASYVYTSDHEALGPDAGHLLGTEYNQSRTTMNESTFTIGTTLPF